MIKSSIVTAGYALISLLCLSSSSLSQDSDYIELPFEFFHGRWVQGHSGELRTTYLEGRSPDYYGSYNFTFGSNRLSINDIQKYFLVNHDLESWRTADISFLKRVKPNWQIGIDRFTYSEYGTNLRTSTELPFILSNSNRKNLFVTASSRYSKNRMLRVSRSAAPYSYSFEPILAKGELQIENQLDLRYNNRINNRYFFTDSIGNGLSAFGDYVSYLWNFQSLIKWGITDQINLYANIASDYGHDYTTRFNERVRGGSIINQSYGSGSSFIYGPSINISVTSALGSHRFLKLEYGQWFNKSGSEGVSYSSSVPLDSVITGFSKTETPFRSLRSHAAVNLRLVKSGKFNSSILLDDYQDYYKGMLFDDQLVIDVGFKVSHFGRYSTPSYENYDLFILSKIGLSDNLNLGARISYSLSHWGYFDKIETVKSYIVGKFRNYKYDSQNGPGWKRDDRYDQVLGSILRPGNLYVEVQYVPPMFGGRIENDIKFFSLKKLGSTGVHSVLVKFQIGLGRNFSATIDDRETYAKKYTVSRRYSLAISKRVLERMNLSLSYLQTYVASQFWDPVVRVSIRALI